MDDSDPMMDVWGACLRKCKRNGLESLTELERVFFLGADFYFQVATHGIDNYYRNPSGDYSVETVWALEQLGAPDAASVLRCCNALFPNGSPTSDQSDRCDLVKGLRDAGQFPVVAYDPGAPEWGDVIVGVEDLFSKHEQKLRISCKAFLK